METKMIIRIVIVSVGSLILLLSPLLDSYPKAQNVVRLIGVAELMGSSQQIITAYWGITWFFSLFLSVIYLVVIMALCNKLAPYLRALLLRFR